MNIGGFHKGITKYEKVLLKSKNTGDAHMDEHEQMSKLGSCIGIEASLSELDFDLPSLPHRSTRRA